MGRLDQSGMECSLIPSAYSFEVKTPPNFDGCEPVVPISPEVSSHSLILATKFSTSAKVLPACKHTLTRSVPLGTVGDTIGLTTNPASWQKLAKLRGSGVSKEKIGEEGFSGGKLSGFRVWFCWRTVFIVCRFL